MNTPQEATGARVSAPEPLPHRQATADERTLYVRITGSREDVGMALAAMASPDVRMLVGPVRRAV